jgi:hypothetical protein
MKYAFEMGSGVMMRIQDFIKIESGIQKLIRGDTQTRRHTHSMEITEAYFYFSQSKESRLINLRYVRLIIICVM